MDGEVAVGFKVACNTKGTKVFFERLLENGGYLFFCEIYTLVLKR